jgi:hypothetical protein
MASDPSVEVEKLREPDGSILFPGFGPSDFMFVPTSLADVFDAAASPHLKHSIWIESAFPKVLDILLQQPQTQHRIIDLCTDWDYKTTRGTGASVKMCIDSPVRAGIVHPFKISNGLEDYSMMYDSVQ